MKVLYLDTSNKVAKIGLIQENQGDFLEFEASRNLFETLTERIATFLKDVKIKKEELSHIAVFEGPGGFTSLRIGIVTANTFGFALNIPIIKITKKEEENLEENIYKKIEKREFVKQVIPLYGKKPNITKSKKVV
jgi:tRNA threonylcarbamoyladenosine biosynthesis protein TsaB